MSFQGSNSVTGACRLKSATWRKPGRNAVSVNIDQEQEQSCDGISLLFCSSPAFFNAFSRFSFTAGIFTFRMFRLGMMMRLHGWRDSAPINLRDSRTRRLARFRFTALTSNFLLHITPQRRISSASAIHNIVKRPDDSRRPICFTLSNSLRQRRLSNAFTGVVLQTVCR